MELANGIAFVASNIFCIQKFAEFCHSWRVSSHQILSDCLETAPEMMNYWTFTRAGCYNEILILLMNHKSQRLRMCGFSPGSCNVKI